jgi:hypothetical protein
MKEYEERDSCLLFVAGLKIEYVLPNNPSSKRIYRVNRIAECPAKLWCV